MSVQRGELYFTIDDEAVVISDTGRLSGMDIATFTFISGPRTGRSAAAALSELRPETTVEEHARFVAGNDDAPAARRVLGTDLTTIPGLRR